MEPVSCDGCAARVEVRKSSWDQTSIQWHADAMDACLERRAGRPASGPNGGAFAGCSTLDLAIREHAVRGDLSVQSGEPLPVNPEGAPH
ncbi:hypothetical protein [Alloactinosynnema sp. L-07]|nr:hypothetical protein [Alloactinosynnema sp. L-07]